MVDVSGIPNMGFGGGGYFGGIPNQQPAMSAAQINAGIWGNYSPGAAQAVQNNIYGAGGFGAQPAYYAGLAAAYGRATGGYGGYGAANADPFTPVRDDPRDVQWMLGGSQGPRPSTSGGSDIWSQGAPAYQNYGNSALGGAADQAWYLGGSQGPRPSESGGSYNAPRSYGWDANEGAPAPAAPQVYNRGEFNPQTYGWDHNEGAPVGGGRDDPRDVQWMLGGSIGPRPSTSGDGGYINGNQSAFSYNPARMGANDYGGAADQGWFLGGSVGPRPSEMSGGASQPPSFPTQSYDWDATFNNTVNGNNSAAYPLGGSSWYPNGGQDDPRDVQWMLGGSQGPRPSSLGPSSSLVGSAWAAGTPAGTRSAVPDARTYMPSGQFGGYLDHYLWGANSGNLGASGIMADPFGGYVPSGGSFGGAADQAWYLGGSQGSRPSSVGGGIGSDALYGGQNTMAGYGAALNALRGGQGWTIAQQPPAVSQEMLGSRINQGIYDIGNAGDYYSRSIGGGFGMGMPNQSQGLTGQDLFNPHAYPPGFRWDQQ